MKKHSRIIALLLSVVMMAALFSGCAKDPDGQGTSGGDDVGNGNTENPGGTGNEEKPEFIYVADFSPVDGSVLQYISTCKYANGKLYICGEYISGNVTETDPNTGEEYTYDEYKYGLFTMNEDGTGITTLPNYEPLTIPEGMEGSSYLERMTVAPDGTIWVVENQYTYYYDLPEDFDETTQDKWEYYVGGEDIQILRKLDETGAELMQMNVKELLQLPEEEYFYMNGFELDAEGNMYILQDTFLHLIDAQGAYAGKLEAEQWLNNVVRLKDGTVGCTMYKYDELTQEEGMVIMPVDFAGKAWGESKSAPQNAWNLFPGDEEYDFYYSDGTSFYGYDSETGEQTKIFNWINCNVNPDNLSTVVPLADGRVIALSSEWDNAAAKQNMELITVEKKPYDQVPQKTVLTYACMYMDYNVRRLIIDFNKKNDQYRIEVQDYSEYNTEEDSEAGMTKLTTEILGGDVPDIISVSNLPIERYAARGMLEDLWPWIDGDQALGGRQALVEPVFNALTDDSGKLWQIVPSFSVYTVAGPTGLVGPNMGWTLSDLMAAYQRLPQGATVFHKSMTKADVMRQCCYMNMDEFVDWTTGECNFNSEEFINILKFADMFPETYEWKEDEVYVSEYQLFKNGQQMLQNIYMGDFQNYQYYKFLMGGKMTFIGYPTTEGNGSAFQLDSGGLAMSSVCQDKEGAWEFMRTLLTEEYQENNVWEFATNKSVFDKKLKEASTPRYITDPETGEQVEESQGSWWIEDGVEIQMYALKQDEVQQILDLINTTDRIYSYDNSMYEIVTEQCSAFFAGAKTAEETAKLVQSRVSLYVNEQR